MDTYELFKQLVPAGSILQSSEGGFSVRTRNDNGFSNSFVSDSDLMTIDVRLPVALRIFETQVRPVESVFVSHILQLWATTSHVETVSGELYAVAQVNSLVVTESTIDIRSYGYTYRVHINPASGEGLLLPTGPGASNTSIAKEWLNQNRPGWLERYHFALDLDMSRDDAFHAMVSISTLDQGIQLPTDTLLF